MVSFALAGGAGAIGSRYDRRKWPAVVVGGMAVGFLFLMLLWQGFA